MVGLPTFVNVQKLRKSPGFKNPQCFGCSGKALTIYTFRERIQKPASLLFFVLCFLADLLETSIKTLGTNGQRRMR